MASTDRPIRGILLAAGAGSRFGGDKLMAPLPDGTPVAVAAARALVPAVDRALAVVRDPAQPVAALLAAEGLEIVACPEAAGGMGLSLSGGVRAARDAGGWVVALADMPRVWTATIAAVGDALRDGALMAAPVFQGRRGHPVGFAASLLEELCSLQGDRGAVGVVRRYASELRLMQTHDSGVVFDVDTPDDLSAI